MRTRSQVKAIAEVAKVAKQAKPVLEAKKSEYVYRELEDIVV
jgi:hypothetical protein